VLFVFFKDFEDFPVFAFFFLASTCSLSMLLISNSVICEGVSPLFISFSIVKVSFRVFAETVSSVFSSTCHYISNALNNESQNLVGQHKRNSTRNKTEETVSTSTTKTDTLLAQVDDLDLSELCRTINEPSDLGDENIDETVSANTLNDSLTIEKEHLLVQVRYPFLW
jgi:hypothetical protein